MSIVKTRRGETLTEFVDMVLEECCSCHIPFMMPKRMQTALKNNRQPFYCPNGHGQSYVGKTEVEKLKEKLAIVEAEKQHREQELQDRWLDELSQRQKLEKQIKRVHKGVCPCCNRSFVNLERHMKTMHHEKLSK